MHKGCHSFVSNQFNQFLSGLWKHFKEIFGLYSFLALWSTFHTKLAFMLLKPSFSRPFSRESKKVTKYSQVDWCGRPRTCILRIPLSTDYSLSNKNKIFENREEWNQRFPLISLFMCIQLVTHFRKNRCIAPKTKLARLKTVSESLPSQQKLFCAKFCGLKVQDTIILSGSIFHLAPSYC